MNNTLSYDLNQNYVELLRIAVPDIMSDDRKAKATNLANFGVILVDEENNLITDEVSSELLEIIGGICGCYNGIFNKHFHQTWEHVADTPLDTLVEEQLMHYFSTYGMEMLTGKAMPMLPAEKCLPDYLMPEHTNMFTIVRLVSKKTAERLFIEKMTTVLKPGYRELNMIESILNIYKNIDKEDGTRSFPNIDIENIRSFEIVAKYCVIANITPEDPQTVLRCLVFLATGLSLLVKNNSTITMIKTHADNAEITKIFKTADPVSLSTIFLRYKPLFLAFKANKEVAPIINKIRRLAVTNHRPLPDVTVANAMNLVSQGRFTEFSRLLERMSIRNMIKLYNYSNAALSDITDVIYNIRNGKSYTTDRKIDKQSATVMNTMVFAALKKAVDQRFKDKIFYIPEGIDYKVPASEKQMLGNIPFGTTVSAESDDDALCVSIAWNNYNGERTDIDLHMNSVAGSFGWNSNYRSNDVENMFYNSILYSGDMTDATNGATESFRVTVDKNALYIATAHLYSGNKDCPFKLFISRGSDFREKQVGMVEIDKALSTPVTLDFKLSQSMTLGYMYERTFTFYGGSLNNGIVPSHDLYVKALNAIRNRCANMMSLTDFIKLGGGQIVTERSDDAIDFSPENVLSQSFFELID